MATLQERLDAAGIRPFPDGRPEVLPDYARIAQVFAERTLRAVGLLPAADDVGVPVVALRLGNALAYIGGGIAGVLDAKGTWVPPAPGDRPGGERLVQTWLSPRLVLLTHTPVTGGGAQRELRAALTARDASNCHWLLLDLTGLDRTGEHLEAIAMLDGVAIVAQAGRTTAEQLAQRMRDIPPSKSLGVMLVGGDEATPTPATR